MRHPSPADRLAILAALAIAVTSGSAEARRTPAQPGADRTARPPREQRAPAARATRGPRGGSATAPRSAARRVHRWPRARRIEVVHTSNDLAGDLVTSVLGPAGPGGPLGWAGPSAATADPLGGLMAWFKPSTYISGGRAWDRWAAFLRRNGGPLSELGIGGQDIDPLAPERLERIPAAFRPDGRYALVGFGGVLGVRGLRGIAGDTGAHGLARDADGVYRDRDGAAARTYVVGTGRRARSRPLYELYSEDKARRGDDNDTTFGVAGRISRGETDRFRFPNRSTEPLLIAVIPEKWGENYNLTIRDGGGAIVARADAPYQVNHAVLRVPPGRTLEVEVSLAYSRHALANSYKLMVVGAKD